VKANKSAIYISETQCNLSQIKIKLPFYKACIKDASQQ
jgi:hypothetical protein